MGKYACYSVCNAAAERYRDCGGRKKKYSCRKAAFVRQKNKYYYGNRKAEPCSARPCEDETEHVKGGSAGESKTFLCAFCGKCKRDRYGYYKNEIFTKNIGICKSGNDSAFYFSEIGHILPDNGRRTYEIFKNSVERNYRTGKCDRREAFFEKREEREKNTFSYTIERID